MHCSGTLPTVSLYVCTHVLVSYYAYCILLQPPFQAHIMPNVNVISQDTFKHRAPTAPPISNQEVPPAPVPLDSNTAGMCAAQLLVLPVYPSYSSYWKYFARISKTNY